MAETVEIEQDALRLDRLQVTRKVDGSRVALPVEVGSPESKELLGQAGVTLVRCRTGFGEFSLRKRKRPGGDYWVAFRRTDSGEKEIGVGRTDAITPDILNDCAVKLYE
jgi:hypothetical protein